MGNIEAVPIASQTKSLVQVIAGDQEGALKTQVKFSRECPIVSQVNSAVQAAMGDLVEAKRIQKEDFLGAMNNLVDAIPIIGHAKGAVHYAVDEEEEGDKAMKAASRTTGVMVGGLIGSAGGPAGAMAGGLAGGLTADALTTGVDSAVHGEYRPAGLAKHVDALANDKAESTPGAVFDLVATIAFDCLAGYGVANNTGALGDAPALVTKPPGYVDEPLQGGAQKELLSANAIPSDGKKTAQLQVHLYRRKAGADFSDPKEDPFERDASHKFMDNKSTEHIRAGIKDRIQEIFARDVETALNNLEHAEENGKEEAQRAVDSLLKKTSRYEVQIQSADPSKNLGLSLSKLGWEGSDVARFYGVRVVLDITPDDSGSSHVVKLVRAFPISKDGSPTTWKQVHSGSWTSDSGSADLVLL